MQTSKAWVLALGLALGACFGGASDDAGVAGGEGAAGRAGGSAGSDGEGPDAGQIDEPGGGDAGSADRDAGQADDGSDAAAADADAATATPDAGSGSGDAGSAEPSAVDTSCTGILTCVGDCPDADDTCPDACYEAGDMEGQDRFLALLTCLDVNACADVECIETQCVNELVECLDPSPAAEPPPVVGPPPGSIPAELVGHWVRPGADEVLEFYFNADGSASHVTYKESTLASCAISVNSQWSNGSVVAEGDQLTVTLDEGVTSVAWIGGCGTGYTNPAAGKVMHFHYVLEPGDPPGLWLTDLECAGEYCENLYRRD